MPRPVGEGCWLAGQGAHHSDFLPHRGSAHISYSPRSPPLPQASMLWAEAHKAVKRGC